MCKKLDAKLIAPCGMDCGVCVGFFGYTMSEKNESIGVLAVVQKINYVLLSRKNAIN